MKYGNGVTLKDVSRLECEEATEILDKYGVSKEDEEIILDMIKEAYHQLSELCRYMK